MKKLMIACTAVAMAAGVQAAAIGWGTGDIKLATDLTTGIQNSSVELSSSSGVTAYLFLSTPKALDASTLWDTYAVLGEDGYYTIKSGEGGYTEKLSNFKAPRSGGGGSVTFDTKDTVDKNATSYASVIITWDVDGDGKIGDGDMFIANSAEYLNASDKATTIKTLGLYPGSATSGTKVVWQSVPEPTSGLLLLLGVAGLALRRRRA